MEKFVEYIEEAIPLLEKAYDGLEGKDNIPKEKLESFEDIEGLLCLIVEETYPLTIFAKNEFDNRGYSLRKIEGDSFGWLIGGIRKKGNYPEYAFG